MHPERIKSMLHQEIEHADNMLLRMMYTIIKGYHSAEDAGIAEKRNKTQQSGGKKQANNSPVLLLHLPSPSRN
jgi:hypothetical protein